MTINKLIIGSRDSKLALIQSNWVKDQLLEAYPDLSIEIIEIKTQGDKILDTALSKIGDKGLFTKELEHELLAGGIDLAVHSMKDLPTQLPEGLEIAVTSVREDVRDVICIAKDVAIDDISQASRVGTSSLRRMAQLKRLYPDIEFVDMRGNLGTRFRKLDEQENGVQAMVLAAAGVARLGMQDCISQYLDPLEVLPAVGQGALAIEINSSCQDIKDMLRVINSRADEFAIKAERAFLRSLEGGCQVPIGAYSEISGDEFRLTGIVASLDGSELVKESIVGKLEAAEDLGYKLGEIARKAGADKILESIRALS